MNRSTINRIIRNSIAFCDTMKFKLPPFAYWTVDQWSDKGNEYDEIRDNALGWDVTDFGSDDFAISGLTLFTIRNGNLALASKYQKPYCEKLMIVEPNQATPHHYHFNKIEDIICRGGGNLLVQVWGRDEQDKLSNEPVEVSCDGRRLTVKGGSIIRLTPGESITLPQYMYHTFWGEAGTGTALVGEVSKVNDDVNDNRFLEELPRFSAIIEDEPAQYLLCTEYPRP